MIFADDVRIIQKHAEIGMKGCERAGEVYEKKTSDAIES